MARISQQAGKQFEQMIEQANHVYKLQGKALVFKSEPSVKTIRGQAGKIVKTIYAEANGLDYFGTLAGGKGIFFEAKQTKGKSFPLKNIKPHQAETIRTLDKLQTTTFLLVRFSDVGKMYLLPPDAFLQAWDGWTMYSNRASIPLSTFEAHGTEIAAANGCAVDWLDAVQTN